MLGFLLLLMTLPVQADDNWLPETRELFFRLDQGNCTALELNRQLHIAHPLDTALYMAYKAVAVASTADCTFNPARKYARFNEGKRLIEEAIARDGEQAEIRFLRLSIQARAPGFLNYSGNINEDRSLLISAIEQGQISWQDPVFTRDVLTFVKNFAKPKADEYLKIEQILTSL